MKTFYSKYSVVQSKLVAQYGSKKIGNKTLKYLNKKVHHRGGLKELTALVLLQKQTLEIESL